MHSLPPLQLFFSCVTGTKEETLLPPISPLFFFSSLQVLSFIFSRSTSPRSAHPRRVGGVVKPVEGSEGSWFHKSVITDAAQRTCVRAVVVCVVGLIRIGIIYGKVENTTEDIHKKRKESSSVPPTPPSFLRPRVSSSSLQSFIQVLFFSFWRGGGIRQTTCPVFFSLSFFLCVALSSLFLTAGVRSLESCYYIGSPSLLEQIMSNSKQSFIVLYVHLCIQHFHGPLKVVLDKGG